MESRGLEALRQSTAWFIDQDPTIVTLVQRGASGKGPGGGVLYGPPTPRSPQTVKLIHQGGNGISTGEGGQDRVYQYVIVLAHDGLVEVGDEFEVSGNKFVVFSMDPDNGYERKAYARQHGKNPTDG